MTKKIICYLAIVFTIVFFVSSCKKDAVDKKADDIAASVAGQYEMNYIKLKSEEIDSNLPVSGLSGKVDVVKKDLKLVAINIVLMKDGQNQGEVPFKEVELKEENASVGLFIGSDKIGTIAGSDLTISIQDDTDELIIKAKK